MGVSEIFHETLLRMIARKLYIAHHKDNLDDNYYLC
jgi:hypothetical protein